MARAYGRRVGRVHRRGCGADHRVPVRTRSCDADGPDGRHRSRRTTRHPDQGPRDPRADAPDHDDRARQDGDGDRGDDVGHRRRRRGRCRPSCVDSARRIDGGRERAPDRPGDCDVRARRGRGAGRGRRVQEPQRPRRRGGRRRARGRRRPPRHAQLLRPRAARPSSPPRSPPRRARAAPS